VPAIYEHHRQVLDAEIDELGHVGNVHYLSWLMQAATDHSIAQGWPWERYRELGGVFVVRRHELDYLRSAMPGERVTVRTWVASAARASCVRAYEIVRGDQLLLRATTTWAFIDLTTGAPRRMPSELIDAFEITGR
jgi:acyl-CoA thioester hydrolase